MLWLSIHCCESTACSLKGGILSASIIAPSSSSLHLPGTRRTRYQSFSCPKSLLEQHHNLPHILPRAKLLKGWPLWTIRNFEFEHSSGSSKVCYLLNHLFFGLVVPRELMETPINVLNNSVMCLLHAHLCPKRKMFHLKYHRYLKEVTVCLSKVVFVKI